MKEMHLLPPQTFRPDFSVALSKSVISAAVAALQPTNQIKQKLRGVSKSRQVTARQRAHAQRGLCLRTLRQIGVNQIICCPNLMKENVRCFLVSVRHQEPRLLFEQLKLLKPPKMITTGERVRRGQLEPAVSSSGIAYSHTNKSNLMSNGKFDQEKQHLSRAAVTRGKQRECGTENLCRAPRCQKF